MANRCSKTVNTPAQNLDEQYGDREKSAVIRPGRISLARNALPRLDSREGICLLNCGFTFRLTSYCLSYTATFVTFFPLASVAVVVTVRLFPSAEMTTLP